jgi:hypothetical protein
MKNLPATSFVTISKIIEQDSKDTTYKFALLKATIDVILLFDQQIISSNNIREIPTGLIVERWIWYYYPLIESEIFLPQKKGEPKEITRGKNISFRKYFVNLLECYSEFGNFEHFYNDYKKKALNPKVNNALFELVKDLEKTITSMPMKYIGKSVTGNGYSIYNRKGKKNRLNKNCIVSTEYLIENFGSFTIPEDYYLVLKYFGGFISGNNSLINYWADFIVRADRNKSLDKEFVLKKLYIKPEAFRDVSVIKEFYKKNANLKCVWSNKKIAKDNLAIDHVLPFTHYLNNDIWNLLPTLSKVNGSKSDKILTAKFIEKRKDIIFEWWGIMHKQFKDQFEEEVRVSLVPNLRFNSAVDWRKAMMVAFKNKADFFTDVKGIETWEYIGK